MSDNFFIIAMALLVGLAAASFTCVCLTKSLNYCALAFLLGAFFTAELLCRKK